VVQEYSSSGLGKVPFATESGKFCRRLGSIFSVDERLQFFDQESSVNASQAAAVFSRVIFRFNHRRRRCVFMDSFFADIGHGHDDERLD